MRVSFRCREKWHAQIKSKCFIKKERRSPIRRHEHSIFLVVFHLRIGELLFSERFIQANSFYRVRCSACRRCFPADWIFLKVRRIGCFPRSLACLLLPFLGHLTQSLPVAAGKKMPFGMISGAVLWRSVACETAQQTDCLPLPNQPHRTYKASRARSANPSQ